MKNRSKNLFFKYQSGFSFMSGMKAKIIPMNNYRKII